MASTVSLTPYSAAAAPPVTATNPSGLFLARSMKGLIITYVPPMKTDAVKVKNLACERQRHVCSASARSAGQGTSA